MNDPTVSDSAGPAGSGTFRLPPLPPAPSTSTSAWPAITEIVRDGGRLKVTKQNPMLKGVLHLGIELVQVEILMTNAFPVANQRGEFVRGALLSATSGRPGAEEIRRRLSQDNDYVQSLAPVVRDHDNLSLYYVH
ncbi:hypothetical protein OF83DRAFT_71107 [Amylostereum chailletii]|nr:hypothetical protein OF83DRAFT_71107 [Amylostereum chailletii]